MPFVLPKKRGKFKLPSAGVLDEAVGKFTDPQTWSDAALNAGENLFASSKPLRTGADVAVELLDAGGSVGREAVTSAITDEPAELVKAGTPKFLAEQLGVEKGQAGSEERYQKAINTPGSKLGTVIKGVGRGVAKTATLPMQFAPREVLDPVENTIERFTTSALVDPTMYASAGGEGSIAAGRKLGTALERSGVKVGGEVLNKLRGMFELGQMKELQAAYNELGGAPEHLAAIAGKNLEFLGNQRFRVGVPFAHHKVGFEPGAVASGVVHKLTGKSIPEDLTGRAGEAIVKRLPGSFGLDKHARDAVMAERAAAVYSGKGEASRAMDELGNIRANHSGLSAEQRIKVAQQNTPRFNKALPEHVSGQPVERLEPVVGQQQAMELGDEPQLSLGLKGTAKPNPQPLLPETAGMLERAALNDQEKAFDVAIGEFRAKHKLNELPPGDPFKTLPAMLRQGKAKEAIKAYEDWVGVNIPNAPDEVKQLAAQAFQTMQTPEAITKGIGMYDAILSVFKEIRLHGNPAWASLNSIEDMHKALAYGIKDPRAYLKAARIDKLPKNFPLLTTPSGTQITVGQFLELAEKHGAGHLAAGAKFGTDQKLSKLQNAVATAGSLGVNQLVKRVDNAREVMMKRAFLLDQLQKGVPVRTAANNMRKILFDINVPHPSPNVAFVQRVLKRVFPFIGYTLRSAGTIPGLVARNPGAAMLPIRAAQAANAEADRDYTPRRFVRTGGAYVNMPEFLREPANNALGLVGGGLEDNETLTLQGRGTLVEPFSAMQNQLQLEGGFTPPAQWALQAAYGVGPFGDTSERYKESFDLPNAALSSFVSSPAQYGINALTRRYMGAKETTVGLPQEYRSDRSAANAEALRIPNLLLPSPLRLTHESDAGFEIRKARKRSKR